MSDHRSSERPASGSVPRTPRYADRGDGWTLAMELLTATFMWGGVGWLADRWLDTAPVLMVLGFVLGNALGVYLIWVRSQDRFTREHTELMARRARTRTVAQGVAPSAPEAARRPEPDPGRGRVRRRAAVTAGPGRRGRRRRDRGSDPRAGST